MMRMPGKSYQGPLPQLSQAEQAVRQELQGHVFQLGGVIGERNLHHYTKLLESADYIRTSFRQVGYEVKSQHYQVGAHKCENLEVEVLGRNHPEEIILVGAHYDSVHGSPGANDNGTGVAALLALSKMFIERPVSRTIRFVAFVNEEPPYFQTADMGSRVYSQRSRERHEPIRLMLSLETMGYYSEEKGSQQYPFPLSFFTHPQETLSGL